MTEEELRKPETAMRIADMNPSYGKCRKCGLPWNHCTSKSVRYDSKGGAFAMCTYCWDRSTVEERVHHYKSLWYEWTRWPFPEPCTLKQMENAVIAESNVIHE